MLANRLVMALLALNVVGAIVAVMLDLPAQLGTNARAGDTVRLSRSLWNLRWRSPT